MNYHITQINIFLNLLKLGKTYSTTLILKLIKMKDTAKGCEAKQSSVYPIIYIRNKLVLCSDKQKTFHLFYIICKIQAVIGM